MKNYSFRVGVSVAIDSQRFRIMRILMDGHVQLEAESDGALSNTTYDELLKKYAEKRVSLSDETQADHATPKPMARSLSTFPESVQQRAIRKKRYLDFLLRTGPLISTKNVLEPLIAECAKMIGDEKRLPLLQQCNPNCRSRAWLLSCLIQSCLCADCGCRAIESNHSICLSIASHSIFFDCTGNATGCCSD